MEKPCIQRPSPDTPRASEQRLFPELYQPVNNIIHAQKPWIRLWKSCQQIAVDRVTTAIHGCVQYPYTHADTLAYPPATWVRTEECLGICTEDVDETVHRLFDECLRPELPRLAGKRLKIEQDQIDRRCLCTNTVGAAVHCLWKIGARPEPMGLRRRRTLFTQPRYCLSFSPQLLDAFTRRCCMAGSGGDWRLISCNSASLNSALTLSAAQSQ